MIKTKKEMLYLGQIIERDKIEFRSNNLILSPTGSGKTHFILEILANMIAELIKDNDFSFMKLS